MSDADFWTLQDAALHAFGPSDWADYYPRMASWLGNDKAAIRESTIERLTMAVFRAEPNYKSDPETIARAHARFAWLVNALEAAQACHPDVLRTFLLALRYHADDDKFHAPLAPWLSRLRATSDDPDIRDFASGAILLANGMEADTPDEALPLLDHPSPYVRACAAHMIGAWHIFDNAAISRAFIADLTAREIARPGVAGPFWSGLCALDFKALNFDPLVWMLDIIERRSGPEPTNLPFNGIDFHVQELADHVPDAVRRLVSFGCTDLALMAATEINRVVDGMGAVLRHLGAHADDAIAQPAQDHLARFYREMHPSADPARLLHGPQWRPGLDVFVIRQERASTWCDVVVLYALSPLDDAAAWAMLDAILPPPLRGDLAKHPAGPSGTGPAPVVIGDGEHRAFTSGALINLQGDVQRREWRRIEIIGRGLQTRWAPFEQFRVEA